ncbi:hypothetical protein STSP_71970 [Streptomyces jeddahensis]|uniref:Uncharacterized protein n=1 Tax=Streptomyces jeddahensis TaxID=1716141 RepID=A0A177HGK1_9ACTN|nr:hypothetical protein STSP_71970 [Streptomyces jeddahensis]
MPMQFWPAAQNAPETQEATASSRSASSMTMTGALPPRSMASFFRPAVREMASPVANPPVKDTMRTSGAATIAAAMPASPLTTVTISSGRPASMRVSTRRSADSGVSADGLRMTALPPAMAGPSLWATRLRGSLNGVMAAMMPSGSRVNQPCRFSEPS